MQYGVITANVGGYGLVGGDVTVPNTGLYLVTVDLQAGIAVTTLQALINNATLLPGSALLIDNSTVDDVEDASISFFVSLTAGDTLEFRNTGPDSVALTQANITILQVA